MIDLTNCKSGKESQQIMIQNLGFSDYFDYRLKTINFDHAYYSEGWHMGMKEMLDSVFNLTDKVTLDIGCSAGITTYLMQLCGSDSYGTDIDPDILKKCPFNIQDHLFCCESTKLTEVFTSQKFDFIHSHAVFEHFPNWEYTIVVANQIADLLNKRGIFFCVLDMGPHLIPEQILQLQKKYYDFDVTHINVWPREKWIELFKSIGLTDISDILDPMIGCFISETQFAYQYEYNWGKFAFTKDKYENVLKVMLPRFKQMLDKQKEYKNKILVYHDVLNKIEMNSILQLELKKHLKME